MDSTKPVRDFLTPYEERIHELGAIAKTYLTLWTSVYTYTEGREFYERELNRIDRLMNGKKVEQ